METQIEQQTPEQQELALAAAKMTAAYATHESAKEALANFWFTHRIPTLEVRAEGDRLAAEVEKTAAAFQSLFPSYMQAKTRAEGW
jgi:hypothetical protein